jgi:DNA-directed RNA polymerase subunit RPC12/RpoP
MPLSSRLRQTDLTLECRYCGHPITKTGHWFVSIHRFKCEACKREVPMGYSDKVLLFNKHARLSKPKPT